MFYIIELRDSDGNDCSVADLLIEAPSKDDAVIQAYAYVKETWPNDEDDGVAGTYHPCECECDHATKEIPVCDECDSGRECSHGGTYLDTDNVEEYPTYQDAREKGHRFYHYLIDLAP